MERLVSDGVWRQLDPYAGQLAGRTVRRLRLTAAAVVALAVAVGALWWSGLVLPRLAWPAGSGGYGWSTGPDVVRHDVMIRNEGWTPVEVLGLGRGGAGLRLVEVRGVFPTTLRPGQTMEAAVVYRVTDCAAVTADPWPVPVRVRRPWGIYTAYVSLPTQTSPAAPEGLRSYTGRDPYAVEWQRALADASCAYPGY